MPVFIQLFIEEDVSAIAGKMVQSGYSIKDGLTVRFWSDYETDCEIVGKHKIMFLYN